MIDYTLIITSDSFFYEPEGWPGGAEVPSTVVLWGRVPVVPFGCVPQFWVFLRKVTCGLVSKVAPGVSNY